MNHCNVGSEFHGGRNGSGERGLMENAKVETKQDIFRILHENRHRLLALGVNRIGLFGSFVRGEQRAGSDIDLLVEFETGRKSFDALWNLPSGSK